MTDQELVEKIEKSMRVLGDFWKASEEEQRFALDISIACMWYILRTMEGSR